MSTFNFYDGTISNNKTETAGGVFIGSDNAIPATMTMTGGTISNNQATSIIGEVGLNKTGISQVTLYIKGETITNNTAPLHPNMYADGDAQIIDSR